MNQKLTVTGKCEKCGEITEIKDAQAPPMTIPSSTPDDWFPFGFQFVGFARAADGEPVSRTHLIGIGKRTKVDAYDEIGCTISGGPTVVNMLWNAPSHRLNLASFSQQDAVDYVKFLIRTTSEYQRFSGNMPTVGGDIDIALLTNHRGFHGLHKRSFTVCSTP